MNSGCYRSRAFPIRGKHRWYFLTGLLVTLLAAEVSQTTPEALGPTDIGEVWTNHFYLKCLMIVKSCLMIVNSLVIVINHNYVYLKFGHITIIKLLFDSEQLFNDSELFNSLVV